MGFFKKKPDPISERSKALNAQIASLESEIKKLDEKLQEAATQPKLRSTALPNSLSTAAPMRNSTAVRDPIFESVDHHRLHPLAEEEPQEDHYNELGVRKYDLAALWRRLRNLFRAPPASNQKLVTYLAAGSIRGLRPLRYEKRVARNRFIALFLILVCLLWGIVAALLRRG
jgi:hypothetical protein